MSVGITTDDSFISDIFYIPRCLLGETVGVYINTKWGLSIVTLRIDREVNRIE